MNLPYRLPRHCSDRRRDTSAPIIGLAGSTPLHFAAANGHTNIICTLLLHGDHVDRVDEHGVTPEMLANAFPLGFPFVSAPRRDIYFTSFVPR